jgi:hypothetical protein
MHIALGSIAACVCVAALVQGCASDAEPADEEVLETNEQALREYVPIIPPELAVPAGTTLAFVRFADGVQIYDCKAVEDADPAWIFRAPVAELYGLLGWPAGTHYAGPTWRARDGSTVVATRVAGVSVDAGAIPWLLLKGSAHAGEGKMGQVTYVQRLFTRGGNAPGGACELGASVEVDYGALYAFYR